MANPRQLLPGSVYMVTRRCTQRQFLLKPSPIVDAILRYCVAYAAEKTGVIIHVLCMMSNHYHAIVSDPQGRIPEFAHALNQLSARALNAHYGRWENLWAAGEEPSYVQLVGPDDVLAKAVYTLTNPVAAGLVRFGSEWRPELTIRTPGRRFVQRPKGFFRANGPAPDEIVLDVAPLPIGVASQAEGLARLNAAIAAEEQQLRGAFKRAGRPFLGFAAVRAQKITDAPTTLEPRRQLSPRIACRNKWRRIEILLQCKRFREHYRTAFQSWRNGLRDVLFPIGTYLMVRRYGAALAAAPS